MKYALVPALIALALATPALAQQQGSLSDFQLQPAPTPTATPQVQGPVDTEGAVPVGPRVIPAAPPSPVPTTQPAPAATATPSVVLPENPSPPVAASPRPGTPEEAPSPRVAPPTPAARMTTAPDAPIQPEVEPLPTPQEAAPQQSPVPPVATATPAATGEEGGAGVWPWILLGLLAAGAAAFFLLRRAKDAKAPTPTIAPPIVKPKVAPGGAKISPDGPALTINAEAVRISRSVMNVTLSYRLSITNNTDGELRDIRIGGDLVSAHGSLPVEQQLADLGTQLQPVQTVERIGPGETIPLAGDIRLPLKQVRPLRQGKSPLLVPLLRLRAESDGVDSVVHTYVVGLKPPQTGARLQPFRLDETPQGYTRIGLRALA